MQKNQNNTSFSPSPTHTWIVPSLARTEHAFTPENPFLFLIFFLQDYTCSLARERAAGLEPEKRVVISRRSFIRKLKYENKELL